MLSMGLSSSQIQSFGRSLVNLRQNLRLQSTVQFRSIRLSRVTSVEPENRHAGLDNASKLLKRQIKSFQISNFLGVTPKSGRYCSISLNSWVTRHRPSNPRIFSEVSQVTETDHELAKEVAKNPRKRRKIRKILPRNASALDLPRRSHD